MDWTECITAFIEVADHKSFAKTAKKLRTTSPTITKRIQHLEAQLGTSLLKRTTRKVVLTDAGVEFYKNAEPLLERWNKLLTKTKQEKQELSGVLRIGALSYLQEDCVIPVVEAFLKKHPKMSLEIYEINEAVSLQDQQIDIFIGVDEWIKTPASTESIKLASSHRYCYASPDYLAEHGKPTKPEQLLKHKCIGTLQKNYVWQLNEMRIRPRGTQVHTDSIQLQIAAAKCGLGITYLCSFFVQDSLREGALVPVLRKYRSKEVNISGYYSKQPFTPQKIVTFLEFMKKHLNELYR